MVISDYSFLLCHYSVIINILGMKISLTVYNVIYLFIAWWGPCCTSFFVCCPITCLYVLSTYFLRRSSIQTLENIEGVIKACQSRETGNIGYKRRRKTQHNMCWTPLYAKNANNVNKT
jgi:hypothetical protein